jgi:hypothetical protein
MAPLPGSGQIDFASIQATFGGGGDIGFAEYYRGGAYVAANAINPNGIPTSGQIAASNFWGAGPVSGQAYSITVGLDAKPAFWGWNSSIEGSISSRAYTTGTAGAATLNFLESNGTLQFNITTTSAISNTDGIFSSININGTMVYRSGASGYSTSSGTTATWFWNSVQPFPASVGAVVPVTIVHT